MESFFQRLPTPLNFPREEYGVETEPLPRFHISKTQDILLGQHAGLA
jgi:hypothetical protein